MRLWDCAGVEPDGLPGIAWIANSDFAFSTKVQQEFNKIVYQALVRGFVAHVMRGVFSGRLIALMAWLLPFAETARLWVIIILSYLIGLGHFSHIVAGAVQTFYVAITGESSWGAVIGGYLFPTFLGNVVGGVGLVAVLNHAQVVSAAKAQPGGERG